MHSFDVCYLMLVIDVYYLYNGSFLFECITNTKYDVLDQDQVNVVNTCP